jgi:hypothetical protein
MSTRRRKIRLIESNAKCSYTKMAPLPVLGFFVWGGVAILNLVRNRVLNLNSCRIWSPAQLNTSPPTPSQPHTVGINCTLTLGTGGGVGEMNQRKWAKRG